MPLWEIPGKVGEFVVHWRVAIMYTGSSNTSVQNAQLAGPSLLPQILRHLDLIVIVIKWTRQGLWCCHYGVAIIKSSPSSFDITA